MPIRGRFLAQLLVVVVLAFMALGGLLAWRTPSAPPVVSDSSADRTPANRTLAARRETRATLDPALFHGKAAEAYRVAREIPHVLDQLQCYCACGSEYGHVSLLSCYVDGHGST
jgi:Protein of unknown function with PCYCGC motif